MRTLVLKLMAASPLLAFCIDAVAGAPNGGQVICGPTSTIQCLPEPAGLELLAIGAVAAIAVMLIKRRKK